MVNLVESMKLAKLSELEAKILKCEQDCKEVWSLHLSVAEKSGQLLQELNQLRCDIAKLKEGGD